MPAASVRPEAAGGPAEGAKESGFLPGWLSQPESYEPLSDHGGFITRSFLSVSSALAQMRLDDGRPGPLSPSAPLKLALGLACILMASLSRNYLFVLALLALVLARAAALPVRALARTLSVATAAAGIALAVMIPAALLGQSRSIVVLPTKAFVTSAIVMEVAITTTPAALTGALRSWHVPSGSILALDLALRGITTLGRVALEALCALRLRSVGRDADKRASLGGVAGSVLLKAGASAAETAEAMACRGFDGQGHETVLDGAAPRTRQAAIDAAWIVATLAVLALFVHLQGAV